MDILITGASRGLGLEATRQYLQQGNRVFATCRQPKTATELQAMQTAFPAHLFIVALEVTDEASRSAAFTAISAQTDAIDVLINNAGVNSRSAEAGDFESHFTFGKLEADSILSVINTNAVSYLMVAQQFFPLLKQAAARNGVAKILNISSWLGSISRKQDGGNYSYSASKATLNMLNRALAFDVKPHDVISIVANPGWVRTDMGGQRAPLAPEESVAGLLRLIARITLDDAGDFFQWDGSKHDW